MSPPSPQSCDTFVVLPSATVNGSVIFGKNSDRPQGEVQEIVFHPAKSHAPGTKLQCTYIEIDQAEETRAVILSKIAWMWGVEMGANDLGVVIGNEAVWSNYNQNESSTKRLLGMDLVRLGLERGTSARNALDIIVKLLEVHGQGGPCAENDSSFSYFNSFLIADATEAYVLETADRLWAAEKVEGKFRNISNVYTIGTRFELSSENLASKAKEAGLWDGSGEFDFAKAFGGKQTGAERFVAGSKLLEQLTAGGKFDASSMMTILRDEKSGICRDCSDSFPSASSQVSVLSSTGLTNSHWFTGTPDTKHSVFKPFVFVEGLKELSPLIRSGSNGDRKHELFKLHEEKYAQLTNPVEGAQLRELLTEVESSCIKEVEEVLKNLPKFDSKSSALLELASLFNDSVDAEARFYK